MQTPNNDINKQSVAYSHLLNKEEWWDILSRFVDVLKINIFIVDSKGSIILPPEEGRFGGKFFFDSAVKNEFYTPQTFLSRFTEKDGVLEHKNCFDLYSYAIAIPYHEKHILGYLIVGPVVLNKKLDLTGYEPLASKFSTSLSEFYDTLNEIRIVSNLMMRSILDLLDQVIKDNVALKIKEAELKTLKAQTEQWPSNVQEMVNEIYSTVRIDELLATLLDVALKITGSESGSILLADKERNDHLCIKVSRGLDKNIAQNTEIPFGEGSICGIAAQENRTLLIKDNNASENRIKHLLKRPEIKESLILPLSNKKKVLGVMTLNSTSSQNLIEDNLENLKRLSDFIISGF